MCHTYYLVSLTILLVKHLPCVQMRGADYYRISGVVLQLPEPSLPNTLLLLQSDP